MGEESCSPGQLIAVPFIKLEFLVPTKYMNSFSQQCVVEYGEIADLLSELTAKYEESGGYTISSPFAPPPVIGIDPTGVPEESFWVMVLIPQEKESLEEVKEWIWSFQKRFNQREILAFYHSVWRLLPKKRENSG